MSSESAGGGERSRWRGDGEVRRRGGRGAELSGARCETGKEEGGGVDAGSSVDDNTYKRRRADFRVKEARLGRSGTDACRAALVEGGTGIT